MPEESSVTATFVAETPIGFTPPLAGDWLAHCKLGLAYKSRRQFLAALEQFDLALALNPASSMAHMDRANMLCELGRLQDALASYESALRIDSRNALAHANYAIALRFVGCYSAAIASFDQALALGAPAPVVLANRGATLGEMRRFDDALADLRAAQALAPDFALAHWNEALIHLARGDLTRGWEKYEWRWHYEELGLIFPRRVQPVWSGAPADLHGKRLLVWAEQGAGDALQFCRYLPLLIPEAATVILQAPSELCEVLRSIDARLIVVSQTDPLPAFDLHFPLLSLPRVLRTTPQSIPAQVPYLRADPNKVLEWGQRLAIPADRAGVGLVWSGSTAHRNDHVRSLALGPYLAQLRELLRLPANWIGLQRDVRESDQAALSLLGLRNVGTDFADFSDTAAVIASLDLVITVDTAVAHLAGAMGRPVWILLPFAADWRWLADREDTPWYLSARLFRQVEPGAWPGLLAGVHAALAQELSSRDDLHLPAPADLRDFWKAGA